MKPRQQTAADGGARAASPGHGAKSPALRAAAILALLEQKNLTAVAAQCGVSERTLIRWTNEDEAFKRELADARRAVFEAGIGRVQALTGKAVEALEACIGSDRETIKLQAARTVIEFAAYHYEAETIVAKLNAIEAQIETQRK